jgi:hypothetical protein
MPAMSTKALGRIPERKTGNMKRTSVSQQIRLQDLNAATQRLAERLIHHEIHNRTGKHSDPVIQVQAPKTSHWQRAVTRLGGK